MINLNTLGNNLKRGILRFTAKISVGLSKPMQKFVAEMIYGIVASSDCKLTEIGRALKEDISLKKTVDRLGRNLGSFCGNDALMANYLEALRPSLGADTMLLVDGGDVIKPCSPKMEAIGSVKDGSTGAFGNGYWTMGVAALSKETRQPIPVYEKLYPCIKQGGKGTNAETEAALQYLREHFDNSVPRIFDSGFDSGDLLQELVGRDEKFIIRQCQNRVSVHNGKRAKINDVVRGIQCHHTLSYQGKSGEKMRCKIGITQVVLPNMKHLKLRMVVCKIFGKDPLVLYTNLDESTELIAVRIVKAYLLRWRIEEYYAFKKEKGLQFEDFRVRSLEKIQTLDLLLTVAIGYIAILCDKVNDKMYVLELLEISKRLQETSTFLKNIKFLCYAIHAGIKSALACLKRGISSYFSPHPFSNQICIFGFEKMGYL